MQHHILSVLVLNRPGVLTRIAGLFSRRGFNIFSLAVSPTDDERYSRMTIVVDVESAPLEMITKQLNKLVPVIKISHLAPDHSVEREMMLITVNADLEQRSKVIELANLFDAQVVDVGTSSMMLMSADHPESLDTLETLLEPFGITDVQRTGLVALPKLGTTPRQLRVASASVTGG
ncbi:MAG: acetolactate synthase small subunit [Actinobacteria bacterium]|nr:acetolactate synthase small subunit [Actinomycetota bacterium]MCB9390748.1 acetolactate synthase small subunit [Acidimicrobiia bacterium]